MKVVDNNSQRQGVNYGIPVLDDLKQQLNIALAKLIQENERLNKKHDNKIATLNEKNKDNNANHKNQIAMYNKIKEGINENHKDLMDELRGHQKDLNKRCEDIMHRQHDLAKRNEGGNVNPADIIDLNIRGTQMFVRRDTLTAVKGSRLEVLFSGRWENQILRDDESRVFIDADPECFKKVLEFLYKVKSTSASSAPLPPLPRMAKERKQMALDVYVRDYFALRPDMKADTANKGTTDRTPEDLLKIMETELDVVEKNLDKEEAFIAAFTDASVPNESMSSSKEEKVISKDNDQPEHCKDEDDEASFTYDDALLVDTFSISTPSITSASNDGKTITSLTNLYVNGEVVTYKTSTIFAEPSFKLAQQLSDESWRAENSVVRGGKLCYLIEQPACAFLEVMNYLHMKSIVVKDSKSESNVPLLTFIRDEAEEEEDLITMMKYYFGEKSSIVRSLLVYGSKIIMDRSEMKQLMDWLPSGKRSSKPELLYRASRDGWSAKDFHDKCDDKGATIVVVKSIDGYVFGGYADVSWMSTGGYKSSHESFLFSLRCSAGLGPVKMGIKNECVPYAVFHYGSSCATFGRGYDLCISPFCNSPNLWSCAHIGNNYHLPTGANGCKSFLTGNAKGHFTTSEWEVFRV